MPDPSHRCRRGPRCLLREPDAGQPVGALLTARDRGLCHRDREALARALRELPELWVALHLQQRIPTQVPSAPRPLADTIRYELNSWASLVRAVTRIQCSRPWVPDSIHPDDAAMFRNACDVGAAAQLLELTIPTLLALPRRRLRRPHPGKLGTHTLVALDGTDGAVILLELHRVGMIRARTSPAIRPGTAGCQAAICHSQPPSLNGLNTSAPACPDGMSTTTVKS